MDRRGVRCWQVLYVLAIIGPLIWFSRPNFAQKHSLRCCVAPFQGLLLGVGFGTPGCAALHPGLRCGAPSGLTCVSPGGIELRRPVPG